MTTKNVYQADLSGFFCGVTEADESPLEPGVFHLPARCTEMPPPEVWPDTHWPRFNGSAWVLVRKPLVVLHDGNEITDPVAKLRLFLNNNPDVADLLQQNS